MKATVLSGGVGGARFLRGVVSVVDPDNVTIIGNVGDDIEVLGLHVSPDLDSVLYALAGVADEERGWGRADETLERARDASAALGGEAWFRLGDRDIGLHLVRTQLLRAGRAALRGDRAARARRSGFACTLLPATDDPLRTFIETPAGTFPFQEWFVARRPPRRGRRRPLHGRARGASRRRAWSRRSTSADVIVIAPSNPYVSIGPILAVEEIRAALERRRVPCVAVSPLIGGRAVKGPADRMLARLAGGTGAGRGRRLLPGPDRRARARRGRRAGRAARTASAPS